MSSEHPSTPEAGSGCPEAAAGILLAGSTPINPWHQELPRLRFPYPGPRPGSPLQASPRRRERLRAALAFARRLTDDLPAVVERHAAGPAAEVTAAEARRAWKRFTFAHFAFFSCFQCLTTCYRQATEHCRAGDEAAMERAVERIATLWRAAGASMLYGVDFSPTEPIYRIHIRPFMSEGLSGTWLREYQEMLQRKMVWNRVFERELAQAPEKVREVRRRLIEAESVYQRLHFAVMKKCVPEMVSMLQEYEQEHGPLEVGEEHLQRYDEWFRVDRDSEMDQGSFLEQLCQIVAVVHGDLETGTGLTTELATQISQGFTVALDVLKPALEDSGDTP